MTYLQLHQLGPSKTAKCFLKRNIWSEGGCRCWIHDDVNLLQQQDIAIFFLFSSSLMHCDVVGEPEDFGGHKNG
jgi:hypothetical protein